MTRWWMAGVLVLVGCSRGDDSLVSMDTPTTTGASVVGLRWTPCLTDLECVTLDVPRDHAQVELGTMPVRAVRSPARSGEPEGVIFVNPGGPGVDPAPLVRIVSLAMGDWGERYDIVGVDPRGGGANPLGCHQEHGLLLEVDRAPTTAQDLDAMQTANSAWVEACIASDGELLPYVSVPDMADDIAYTASEMGWETFGYYGISGGSVLGALVAEQHPERVWRMALDSSVPTSSWDHLVAGQLDGLAGILAEWADACSPDDSECALGQQRLELLDELLVSLKDKPLVVRGRELTYTTAMYGVFSGFYNESQWDPTAEAIQAALNGDGAPLLGASDAYFVRNDDGYYDGMSTAFNVLACSFGTTAREDEALLADAAASFDFLPHFGPLFDLSPEVCRGLPEPRRPLTAPVKGAGAGPILMLQSRGDFATPLFMAEEANEALEESAMVVWEGTTHGTAFSSPCAMQHMLDYFESGELPNDGTICSD